LGSEVQLGAGYADILAVESGGRPSIIEVKLVGNPESRRAVVSQVLAYAASLRGLTVDDLEQGPLRRHLSGAGHESALDAVQSQDQEGAVDAESLTASLQEHLDRGSFRVVLVLDDVPSEPKRIVGYLDVVTAQTLIIYLLMIKVFEVNGAQIALPERLNPGLTDTLSLPAAQNNPRRRTPGVPSEGSNAFRSKIADTTGNPGRCSTF